jgi:hypothetical protein
MKEKGLRFNQNKIKTHLIPPFSMEQLGRVLTFGADKYGENNYRKGMPWSTVIGSLKRHLLEFEKGVDFDPETGSLHMAHILCNALFLLEYYKIAPHEDDRETTYITHPKIALDIDGVLADFSKSFRQRIEAAGMSPGPFDEQVHWKFPYSAHKELWEKLKKDKDFWLNLEPVCDPKLPFEPVAYVTFREIPTEWTEEWLAKHGFPCEKVYSISGGSKSDAIRESGADIFVDDCYETFVNLNKEGVTTFLFDKPYNSKYSVGYRRIKQLSDLVTGAHLYG